MAMARPIDRPAHAAGRLVPLDDLADLPDDRQGAPDDRLAPAASSPIARLAEADVPRHDPPDQALMKGAKAKLLVRNESSPTDLGRPAVALPALDLRASALPRPVLAARDRLARVLQEDHVLPLADRRALLRTASDLRAKAPPASVR